MIIFDKFGDGQAERNRTVSVFPSNRRQTDGIDSVHSRRLIRANLRLQRLDPLSNRELDLLERGLSHCKQREATNSNRELSTVCTFGAPSALTRDRVAVSLRGPRIAGRNSRPSAPFLTGSASQTEFVVTSRKQTMGKIRTGARTAIKDAQFRAEFRTESHAQAEKECRSRDAAEQSKIPLHTRNEKELL